MAIENIPLELIDENPFNPRKHYAQNKVYEMAHSLREIGLRQVPEGRRIDGKVQLAYGHMRLRGFIHNRKKDPEKWESLPIDIKEISDQEMFDYAWEENLRRTDITPLELARCVQSFSELFPEVQEKDIGAKHGMTEANVSNMKRVLRLPAKFLEKIDEGVISFTQGRELLTLEGLPDAERVMSMALENVKTGNKQYGYPNTVEGLQKGIHDAISRLFPPLEKEYSYYRFDLVFDTRTAGCLQCEKMIRTHPTKSQTAHFCSDEECWKAKQVEHREKAAAAAKAKMQAEVINKAAQVIAQEEKVPQPSPVLLDENTVLVDQEIFDKLEASNSCSQISEGKPVRKPVEFEGKLYLATGSGTGEVEAYVCVPPTEYKGKLRTYQVPVGRKYEEYYESLRNDPNGFYHGMVVKQGKVEWVLVGPKVTFVTKVDKSDFSQEKSAQWRCGQCNQYFEFVPPPEGSTALVECPACQYGYVTYRRADGVAFCYPQHNYTELPKVTIPSTLLGAGVEEELETRADERDRQMEEARERANLERPAGEIPCETCLKGQTCDRSYFYVAQDDSGRYVCDQWECDHVSWAEPPEQTQEIPEEVLQKAKEAAGTRAEVLDLNDISTGNQYSRQMKSGYVILSDELRHVDEPEECLERCTHGFHYGFDSKAREQREFYICSDTKCLAKKKGAFTRKRNAAGQARKNAEKEAIKLVLDQVGQVADLVAPHVQGIAAVSGVRVSVVGIPRPVLQLIIYNQLHGAQIARYYYGDRGKEPTKWFWDKLSAGTPQEKRSEPALWKLIDKLSDADLTKLIVEMMFFYLQDHGGVASYEIKTVEPLTFFGIPVSDAVQEKASEAAGDAEDDDDGDDDDE